MDRTPLDELTSDQLDQLYDDLDAAHKAVTYFDTQAKRRKQRAETAEATVARVRQMATYWEKNLPETVRTPAVVSALLAATDPTR